jgi:carboxypeptidase C (cathepsin A)
MFTRYFAAALLAGAVLAAPAEDVMGNLPDAPAFTSATYSGYLTVSDTKQLHYVFAESYSAPATDPIIIWFNGGPGCSSMLGFMQENGPVVVDDGETTFFTNPYPWNTRANVLWIESPAGVGWSIAETAADLQQNDMTQSEDALAALKAWYVKFPEYSNNQLFVSGESYAGIYVPYLSWQIYQNNKYADMKKPNAVHMNLQGFMVGNGATKWEYDVEPSFPDTAVNFNVIDPVTYNNFVSNNCHYYFYPGYSSQVQTPTCDALWLKINNQTKDLNWYDLYRPVYDSTLGNDSSKKLTSGNRMGYTQINGELKSYRRGYTMQEYTPWAKHLRASGEEPPILGDFITDYMNRQDVRDAFNIPSTVQTWEMCSSTLQYHEQHEGSFWIYGVLKDKYRMMFYSGDTDGAVPTYGSKQWIKDLNWAITEEWRPWYTDSQVSGYMQAYAGGLDFVTVKGVGHMAPQWARQPVTDMITAWVWNQPF